MTGGYVSHEEEGILTATYQISGSEAETGYAWQLHGQATVEGSVTLYSDGTYEISAAPPEVSGTAKTVLSVQDTCEQGSNVENESEEGLSGRGAFIEGAVDPKAADRLAGHSSYRDPYTGAQIHVTWNLVFQ